jgi:hypothetical protein
MEFWFYINFVFAPSFENWLLGERRFPESAPVPLDSRLKHAGMTDSLRVTKVNYYSGLAYLWLPQYAFMYEDYH